MTVFAPRCRITQAPYASPQVLPKSDEVSQKYIEL